MRPCHCQVVQVCARLCVLVSSCAWSLSCPFPASKGHGLVWGELGPSMFATWPPESCSRTRLCSRITSEKNKMELASVSEFQCFQKWTTDWHSRLLGQPNCACQHNSPFVRKIHEDAKPRNTLEKILKKHNAGKITHSKDKTFSGMPCQVAIEARRCCPKNCPQNQPPAPAPTAVPAQAKGYKYKS